MKIGFNEATTMKNSTLEKDLEFSQKHGYDYIEIRLDKLKEYLKNHSVEELADFFARSNIKPYTFNALEFITFRDEKGYSVIKEDLVFLCEVGRKISCDKIIVVPTFDILDKTVKEIKEESIRVLHELSDIAAKYDVKLAYEFVGYPNCSVNTFGQTYDIVKDVKRDNVGMVLDCFHFYAMNSKLEDLKNADINKIFVLHIDDSEDLPVGILRDNNRLWPGEGVVPLKEILTILKDKGFDDCASVELFRPEYWDWDIEKAIKVGKEKTENVLREVYK